MTLSLFDITVPVFIRGFRNLSANLEKARAHAEAEGIPVEDIIGARLFPDMLPLSGQVQRASDTAKFVPARVGGLEAPAMPDTETSFADLVARIDATVVYLKTVPADAFDGRAATEVALPAGGGRTINFTARDYVLNFAVPNFYFHLSIAHGIMRHKGVAIGKLDFLGGR